MKDEKLKMRDLFIVWGVFFIYAYYETIKGEINKDLYMSVGVMKD
jgi:hypothetical protein